MNYSDVASQVRVIKSTPELVFQPFGPRKIINVFKQSFDMESPSVNTAIILNGDI